jgi:shikimate kinase
MEEPSTPRIALIGISGAGKSAVAPLLARRLGMEAVDLDEQVERVAGMSVAAIFETQGEPRFRALEAAALREALDADQSSERSAGLVLALGGGVLGRDENRSLLRERGFVAWLQVAPETAARRIGSAGAAARPLVGAAPVARLRELLAAREEGYRAVAHAVIDTEGRTPEEVAESVAAAWEARAGWGSSAA